MGVYWGSIGVSLGVCLGFIRGLLGSVGGQLRSLLRVLLKKGMMGIIFYACFPAVNKIWFDPSLNII